MVVENQDLDGWMLAEDVTIMIPVFPVLDLQVHMLGQQTHTELVQADKRLEGYIVKKPLHQEQRLLLLIQSVLEQNLLLQLRQDVVLDQPRNTTEDLSLVRMMTSDLVPILYVQNFQKVCIRRA